jgi:hypothetical protein
MKLIIRESILKKLSKSISLLEIDPISSIIFNFHSWWKSFNLLGLLLPKQKTIASQHWFTNFLVKSSRGECEGEIQLLRGYNTQQ